ncbi:hypothetical protein N7G274_000622 [Stereocaulon virgatum]|uniref:Uncharacterized protein n=1 Tax=Stereocaulon virgatum TaxID=373712 RepID=A0ABR4AS14_9LECA
MHQLSANITPLDPTKGQHPFTKRIWFHAFMVLVGRWLCPFHKRKHHRNHPSSNANNHVFSAERCVWFNTVITLSLDHHCEQQCHGADTSAQHKRLLLPTRCHDILSILHQ